MGVSPMLFRIGSVCRATGAVLALVGLSNASASCSRLGSGAVCALVGGVVISSDSEGKAVQHPLECPSESAADHSLTGLGSVSIALASAAGFGDPRFR